MSHLIFAGENHTPPKFGLGHKGSTHMVSLKTTGLDSWGRIVANTILRHSTFSNIIRTDAESRICSVSPILLPCRAHVSGVTWFTQREQTSIGIKVY